MRNTEHWEIKSQANFCFILAEKLKEDIYHAKVGYAGLDKRIRIQEDIRRLRRELSTLSKMLDPYADGEE